MGSMDDPRSQGLLRMDGSDNDTNCSEGEMSITSEEAVVVMTNRNDEHEAGEMTSDKVCGRVMKRHRFSDPASIPTEIMIEMSEVDQSRMLMAQQSAPCLGDETLRTAPEEERTKSETHRPMSKPQSIPQAPSSEAHEGINQLQKNVGKKEQADANQTSIHSSTMHTQERQIMRGRNVGNKSVSFSSSNNTDKSIGSSPFDCNSSDHQRHKSSNSLNVIAEDESVSSRGKSVVFQSTGSVSDELSVENTPSLSTEQSAPISGHAKSMARELLKRHRSRKKDRLQEEGRLAIFSQSPETEYVKVVVEKPESVKKLIYDAISVNILFQACSSEELTALVEVFTPSEASAGSAIIRQGAPGDDFYVLEKGTVDVYEGDSLKATLYSGKSFGEIALLYGCPRTATLRTRYYCKLWSISRSAFQGITRQFKERQMEANIKFLNKVKIKDKVLGDILNKSQINTMALATTSCNYEAGQIIVKEGESGDTFYMIDSGSVDVFIKASGTEPVATLTSGQFFGELALLSNSVRNASCVAKTDVKCLTLMRDDFNLLLGDLQLFIDGDYCKSEEEEDEPDRNSKVPLNVKLSDLNVLKVLGVGAFGSVRLAKLKHPVEDVKNDNEYFALKCISKQSLKENGLHSRVMNEKSIMMGLEHPFINCFYCEMEDEINLYFLLEALPGGELCKRLREEKCFLESTGKFYSASVLFAFCHMHAKKIAYRDLKPENLVMDSIGYVKVVDFGLAKVIDAGKTWTLCGTPAYLAPEIVLNDGHDWAVDYWALGVFLFEMTSGKEPFPAKSPMEVYKQIVSGYVEIPPSFSPLLEDLIKKLLNSSKSKRLGRTMGGGGAVMQHRWYSDFDWDGMLEKRLDVPFQPKTREILCEDSVASDSKGSSAPSKTSKVSASKHNTQSTTYSLGQGNRHAQTILEMMDNSAEHSDAASNLDTVRMTMMRVIKQDERWSKTSHQSGNTSTRNTSLGEGSISVRNSVDQWAHGEICLKLQLMHMSLASKDLSLASKDLDRPYQQFSLLSISPSSLLNESDLYDHGDRFLDPFITKNVALINQFPSELTKSSIDADALAAFCFPNGLKIRLIPRCAAEGARRLGWLGESGDNYQLQGFTDAAGSLTHGCAITIREELIHSDASELVSVLSHHRKRRMSVAVIVRWLRKQYKRRSKPFLKKKNSIGSRAKSVRGGRRITGDLRGSISKVMSKPLWKSMGTGSDEDVTIDDDLLSLEYLAEDYPGHIRCLGRSAYRAMVDAEKFGYMCIVEVSYVLTGTALQDQSLLFCALQNLIDMERKANGEAARMTESKKHSGHVVDKNNDSHKQDEGTHASFDPEHRQTVLSILQSKLSLTLHQRSISYPRNELEHVNFQQHHFDLDLSIMGLNKISLPLPLPQMSSEWGLSTLFLCIKDSGLLILLKLLLLERSVLVLGDNSEEVTACATALLGLLEPYTWASAFIPLLPMDMLDFVGSPVPFISGMMVEGKKHLQSIIHDSGVKEAMMSGLSIVNLVSGKLIVTREKGTSDMLRRSFQTIPELSLYQKRLELCRKSSSSNLRSFRSFFRHGASRKESLTLLKIKNIVKKHMAQFTTALRDKPEAWRQYGEFNEAIGTFDFCPDKYIQPLKDHALFQIQFQEMMAHTQLFLGYVESLQLAHEKRKLLMSGPAAHFIARWVEFQWYTKKGADYSK